jgi:hypothetical protein
MMKGNGVQCDEMRFNWTQLDAIHWSPLGLVNEPIASGN